MDVKFGKITPCGIGNGNIIWKSSADSHENFFTSNSHANQEETKQETSAKGSRINDLDSNILENNAYQTISDEIFKLEHKIGLLENILSKIENEIEALKSLGYVMQISELEERKQKIEQELAELNKKYSELGLSAKISGQIASAMNFTSKNKYTFSRLKFFISKNILAKISKKINYSQNMKEALEKLSSINTNVDELIKLQVPYGETPKRYEKLTAYLNKANVIHSQISHDIENITNKSA